jgi:hypothetical protein
MIGFSNYLLMLLTFFEGEGEVLGRLCQGWTAWRIALGNMRKKGRETPSVQFSCNRICLHNFIWQN